MNNFINLPLMQNPVNWITVTLVVLLSGLALDLLTRNNVNGDA